MKYAVFDVEVTAESSFGRFCNPLDLRNTITCYSLLFPDKPIQSAYNSGGISRDVVLSIDAVEVLVGQNIKFDLLYLWKNPSIESWLQRGGVVWDTMLAEYLLTGQQKGQKDLDSLSLKYGGTPKDSQVKDMYAVGLKSNQIPKDVLLEYNKADVKNTEIVFKAQFKEAKRKGMLPLMKVYMRHLLAVCEMEYNGLHVDRNIAELHQKQLEKEVAELEENLLKVVTKNWPQDVSFNVASANHWSLYLFGGKLPTIRDIPTGEVYKGGRTPGAPKTRKEKVYEQIQSKHIPKQDWRTKKEGIYSVEEEVLVALQRKKKDPLLEMLLEYRGKFKLLSTYYYKEHTKANGDAGKVTGILTKVHPATNTLHSEFKMALTETGRLSSANPNAQNLPASILDMFTSRWGDEGCILEFDYSQLEVVVQAYLAQSLKMIADIEAGKDFHRLRLAYALDTTYEDVINVEDYAKKRKEIAKPISFQKAYGAMPLTVSEKTGIPLDVVEKVFQAEDEEYPEIKQFYESVQQEILRTRRPTLDLIQIRDKQNGISFTRENEKLAYGYYRSITGKMYTFKEKAVKTKKSDVWRYFNQPEIQNYPVQGTAADLVAMQVGVLFRELMKHRDKCLMVNEVHDSIIIDCKNEFKQLIIDYSCAIMTMIKINLKNVFNVDFNVAIKVDVKEGKSWVQCKED